MNLFQRLAAIRKTVEVMQHNKSGYGYTYVSEDAILAKITVCMEKYRLMLYPGIIHDTTQVTPYTYEKTKSAKNGTIYQETNNEVLVSGEMVWTWVNIDNPEERLEVPWLFVGQQSDASQAFGAGLTYADRYFLLKFFNVATVKDDPDTFRSRQKQTEIEADREIAEKIIEQVDQHIKMYLAQNPKKSEDVKALASRYAKGGNYFNIKESVLAAKLLQDIQSSFALPDEAEHN